LAVTVLDQRAQKPLLREIDGRIEIALFFTDVDVVAPRLGVFAYGLLGKSFDRPTLRVLLYPTEAGIGG
jgi:hypothetical protein